MSLGLRGALFGRSFVFGTREDDVLTPGSGRNLIVGLAGDDTIATSEAGGLVLAGAGDDTVSYLGGDLTVRGGAGDDEVTVDGGVLDYLASLPPLTPGTPTRRLDLADGTGETLTLVGVERLTFEGGVTVFLDGTNNAVLAEDDAVTAAGAGVTRFEIAAFTANDIEFDGDTLTGFALLSAEGSNGGTATVNADGTLDFDAAGDFDGLLLGETATTTFEYSIDDGRGGLGTATITVTVEGTAEPVAARINEIHYDNDGADAGEFVEVRVAAGADVSELLLELYNGANGEVYAAAPVGAGEMTTDGTFDYYVLDIEDLGTSGIQNGAPDGLALSNGGTLIEFLSYEGTFAAAGGAASGTTSTDIGVAEGSSTPVGFSLQRGEGDAWDAPRAETRGADNTSVVAAVFLNEIAVSTTGAPDFEFFELFGAAGTSLDGYSLIQVEAATAFDPGNVLTVISLDGQVIGEDGFFLAATPEAEADLGVTGDLQFADESFENFDSTFLLVRDVEIVEGTDLDADDDGLIDPEIEIVDGVGLADSGPSLFYGGVEVVGPDGSFLAPGARRTEDGGGEFVITPFGDPGGYTPGATNEVAGELALISEIQGAGEASGRVGEGVRVEAIVTAVVSNGFFLQEEDADADGDAATSEGIFVFTGGTPSVAVGDLVAVTGTVGEFEGETQLSNATVMVIETDQTLPTAAALLVGPTTTAADYEAVEGMRVAATSATADALTITANFNFDRFGELQVSAGNKRQPTQSFEPGSPEALAAIEANANNTLILADPFLGFTNQNPDSYEFIPNTTAGDNGNGFLDAGDTFEEFTLRLGTEITAPVVGVMKQEAIFDDSEYKLIVTDQLTLDPDANPRPALEEVGGTLQVASVNVLNYFATLDEPGAGVGPNNLDPRGADTQSELDRQTEKLVLQLEALEAEVLALQELGNDGFGPDGSIATLTAALNEAGGSYDFVNPLTGTEAFVGTDAITTGILYDTTSVSLVYADVLVFEEASAATTFALADVLNPFASPDDQVGDFQRNRPAVAATFQDEASGAYFTVVSVHFKSKGDSNLEDLVEDAVAAGAPQADIDALLADPNYDQGDGQGFWNAVRTDAAEELSAWITGDYLSAAQAVAPGVGDEILVLGDFNAYAEEDPTQVFGADPGFTDIVDGFVDGGQDAAYSFVFDGQQGTLDQGFASAALADDITDAFEWHVNADEPDLLNYDESFTDPAFYDANPFGASDHDPLLVGLDLGPEAIV